jgi:hypothetical protein
MNMNKKQREEIEQIAKRSVIDALKEHVENTLNEEMIAGVINKYLTEDKIKALIIDELENNSGYYFDEDTLLDVIVKHEDEYRGKFHKILNSLLEQKNVIDAIHVYIKEQYFDDNDHICVIDALLNEIDKSYQLVLVPKTKKKKRT